MGDEADSRDGIWSAWVARNRSDASIRDIEGNIAEGFVSVDGPDIYWVIFIHLNAQSAFWTSLGQ